MLGRERAPDDDRTTHTVTLTVDPERTVQLDYGLDGEKDMFQVRCIVLRCDVWGPDSGRSTFFWRKPLNENNHFEFSGLWPQIGRKDTPDNDFVVKGPLTTESSGPVSRYAFRSTALCVAGWGCVDARMLPFGVGWCLWWSRSRVNTLWALLLFLFLVAPGS